MNINRIIIGISLALACIFIYVYSDPKYLYWLACGAVIYDSIYTSLIHRKRILGLCMSSMLVFNYYGYKLHDSKPIEVILILFIGQLSDVYQFMVGRSVGRNYIGWISPRKTYEGYVGGLLMTYLTFIPVYHMLIPGVVVFSHNIIVDITLIYVMGVIGGLISSLIKRLNNIKDYSNLLSSHGGWIDRMDSVIIALIYCILMTHSI
jgi:CDP-diglyceride synthetase